MPPVWALFSVHFSQVGLEKFTFYANQFRFKVVSVSALDELSLPNAGRLQKMHQKNVNFLEMKTINSNRMMVESI